MKKSIQNATEIKLNFMGNELNLKASSIDKIDSRKGFNCIVYENGEGLIQSSHAWEWEEDYLLQEIEYEKSYGVTAISWDCEETIYIGVLLRSELSGKCMLTLHKDISSVYSYVTKKKSSKKKRIPVNFDCNLSYKPKGSYVYFHCLKGTNIPFYIGKGTGERYKNKSRNNACNRMWRHNKCEVIIKKDKLTSKEALEYESYLIQKYSSQGVVLTNLMD